MKTGPIKFWQFALRHSRSAFRYLRGYTLVELLVVIAVILILASMILAVTMSAINQSNKARAMSDVKAIRDAILTYYAEYGKYPSNADGGWCAWTDQTYSVLSAGANTQGIRFPTANPKNIVFLTLGANQLCGFWGYPVDPWGSWYGIMMDYNYDGKIDTNDSGSWGSPNCGGNWSNWQGPILDKIGVAVWSNGPNKTNEWGQGDDIASWK